MALQAFIRTFAVHNCDFFFPNALLERDMRKGAINAITKDNQKEGG